MALFARQPGWRPWPAIRSSDPSFALLVFHLCLIADSGAVVGRGPPDLSQRPPRSRTEGEAFERRADSHRRQGPFLHRSRLDQAASSTRASGSPMPGLERDRSRATRCAGGARRRRGDRVRSATKLRWCARATASYTTSDKGFAPAFVWHRAGAAGRCSAACTCRPIRSADGQRCEWRCPARRSRSWTVRLPLDELTHRPEGRLGFRLPPEARCRARNRRTRARAAPGQAIELAEGRLALRGPAPPGWATRCSTTGRMPGPPLLGCCSLGALGWHFWRSFAARPWNEAR